MDEVYSTTTETVQRIRQEIEWPSAGTELYRSLLIQSLAVANCATKLITVDISRTNTRLANSLRANSDVCNGLVY